MPSRDCLLTSHQLRCKHPSDVKVVQAVFKALKTVTATTFGLVQNGGTSSENVSSRCKRAVAVAMIMRNMYSLQSMRVVKVCVLTLLAYNSLLAAKCTAETAYNASRIKRYDISRDYSHK